MPEINLLKESGIEGDFHQGGKKQISLLSAGIYRWMDAQKEKGLCFGRFRENILVEGSIGESPLEALKSGALLSIGSAVLRISAHSKHCFDECALLSNGMPCRLSGCVCFADVAESGVIRVGDRVTLGP